MAEKDQLTIYVIGFIAIILAVVFTDFVGDTVNANTELSNIQLEQITITSGSGRVVNDNVRGVSFFGNATNNTVKNTGLTFGTDVNFSRNGTIQVTQIFNVSGTGGSEGIVFGNGQYNVTYTYEGDNYVVDTKTHPFIKLLTLFFAIVAVGIGLWLLNKNGFIDMPF